MYSSNCYQERKIILLSCYINPVSRVGRGVISQAIWFRSFYIKRRKTKVGHQFVNSQISVAALIRVAALNQSFRVLKS